MGQIDNGIVAVTSLWADERVYWPVPAVPTRRRRGSPVASGIRGSQLAVELVQAARRAGIGFRAVVADCFYGDNPGFTQALTAAKLPFVRALKPPQGHLGAGRCRPHPGGGGPRPRLACRTRPGRWRRIQRRFRDGHTESWWAADATLGGFGPDQRLRLVVATTDPGSLPGMSSWYLLTNLPRPASRRAQQADLAEVVRLDGLRNWVEQGYTQVKVELGWADFQVRGDRAIRRHWTLVCCAFSFCWQSFLADHPTQPAPSPNARPYPRPRGGCSRPVLEAEPAVPRSWPQALRWVRAWLVPWTVLQRCWRSWSPAPRPRQLQVLLDAVAAGRPLHL